MAEYHRYYRNVSSAGGISTDSSLQGTFLSGTLSHPFISTSPWNTLIDKANTTYSEPGSIQNQQFLDSSLANTWIQNEILKFSSSASDPVAVWTYDTLNDHGNFSFGGSLQIRTPSDMTVFPGSDEWAISTDSALQGTFSAGTISHPFISTSLWNTLIDKANTRYSAPGSIQNQQFHDSSLANTWIQNDVLKFSSSASDPVAVWTTIIFII